jgi:hypothetical protein
MELTIFGDLFLLLLSSFRPEREDFRANLRHDMPLAAREEHSVGGVLSAQKRSETMQLSVQSEAARTVQNGNPG